jgi:hypothetical protein
MRIDNRLSGFSAPQIIEQFHQARLVRVAHGRFSICLDPFRVLNPEVVVNLLPELNVSMDLMMQGHWLGRRFMCGAGWPAQLDLSVSALSSKTNEFHTRLSSAMAHLDPRGKPSYGTTHRSASPDAFKHRSRGSWIVDPPSPTSLRVKLRRVEKLRRDGSRENNTGWK